MRAHETGAGGTRQAWLFVLRLGVCGPWISVVWSVQQCSGANAVTLGSCGMCAYARPPGEEGVQTCWCFSACGHRICGGRRRRAAARACMCDVACGAARSSERVDATDASPSRRGRQNRSADCAVGTRLRRAGTCVVTGTGVSRAPAAASVSPSEVAGRSRCVSGRGPRVRVPCTVNFFSYVPPCRRGDSDAVCGGVGTGEAELL